MDTVDTSGGTVTTTTTKKKTGPWWDPYNTGNKPVNPADPTSTPTAAPTGPWWDPYNTGKTGTPQGTSNPAPPTSGPVLDPVVVDPTTGTTGITQWSGTAPVIKPAGTTTDPTKPTVDPNAAILAALASLYPARSVENSAPYALAPTGGGQVESSTKNRTMLILALIVAAGAFWYYKKHKKAKAPKAE